MDDLEPVHNWAIGQSHIGIADLTPLRSWFARRDAVEVTVGVDQRIIE